MSLVPTKSFIIYINVAHIFCPFSVHNRLFGKSGQQGDNGQFHPRRGDLLRSAHPWGSFINQHSEIVLILQLKLSKTNCNLRAVSECWFCHFEDSKTKTEITIFHSHLFHNETSEEAATSSSKLIPSKEGTRNSFSPRYDKNLSSSEVKEKLMLSNADEKFLLRNNRVSGSPSEAQGRTKGVGVEAISFRHSSVIGGSLAYHFLLTMFGTIENGISPPPPALVR
ncbi:hypothetical protein CDAR_486701 [Caerostris darwini]|uniref:Uncharacterized protein n=1 Tax=Caerostris darwini TaxID=1538125 RepID=A0AAV4P2M9_9ARAC|nr:hypothetical protein CDAR_486701 [Caerostris darwini]